MIVWRDFKSFLKMIIIDIRGFLKDRFRDLFRDFFRDLFLKDKKKMKRLDYVPLFYLW